MSKNGKKFIGVCVCKVHEYLTTDFVNAIIGRAYEYGYKVIVYSAFTDFYYYDTYEQGELKIFDAVDYDILDGLIIFGETIKDDNIINSIVTNAKKRDIFVVATDKHLDGCFNIEFNYRTAFEAIVKHVVEKHGAKTLNMVAGIKNNDFSEERVQSFNKVLREHGIEPDPERLMYGDFWGLPTEKAFEDFMAKGLPLGDAFICANDTMAMTICSKLAERGISVPDDVIVTGFDGIFAEQFHLPRLTTAKQDTALAGERAVDAIAAHLKGRDPGSISIIDHRVTWTHSCGCKPINYKEAMGKVTRLFDIVDDRDYFDGYMNQLCRRAAEVSDLESLNKVLKEHGDPFTRFYLNITLDENFMNVGNNHTGLLTFEKTNSDRKLVLVEVDDAWHANEPYYTTETPKFYDSVWDKYTAVFMWSIHYHGECHGYCMSAISNGCDGFYRNDKYNLLEKLSRNLNHVMEIAHSQAVQRKVIAKLEDLYIRDHVTGLYNRRGFYNELNHQITDAKADDVNTYDLVIISVDMDGLKYINDNFGHAEGDYAIKSIAGALITCWGENEICSRFGGDEFTVSTMCKECDPDERAASIIEKITEYLKKVNETSDKPFKVGFSYGISHSRVNDNISVDELIKAADDLMYKQKATHKQSRLSQSGGNA